MSYKETLVYVVEDSATVQKIYKSALETAGHQVMTFTRAEDALRALETQEPDTICLDLELPGMSGMDALKRIRARRPHIPVVILTSERDAKVGVQTMKAGARDYLIKPVGNEHLVEVVKACVDRHQLVLENRRLKAQVAESMSASEIIGQTPAIHDLRTRIGLVLDTDVTVLLYGESGTGKELAARSIHDQSRRAKKPFVAVNCGALPKELQESYFFGHEQGAFTGATRRHEGFFEEAQGGTLFLDEIGELSAEAQVTLLRALQEREIRRVGGDKVIPVDVRVVSASNRDLKALVDDGTFREDLYYRLAVYPVKVPALRDRLEDVALLAGRFLRHYADQLGVSSPEITPEALDCLLHYRWPGNVRELQNTIQFALLACQGDPITPEHLPEAVPRVKPPVPIKADEDTLALKDPATQKIRPFAELEMEIVLRAIALADGNMTQAARDLGLGRATLYRRLQTWKAQGEDIPDLRAS